MSADHPFDAVLDAAFHEGQHYRNMAKLRELPPNPDAWLDDAEKYAGGLPDEMPQKRVIQKHVQQARCNLDQGNTDEAKFFMLQIEENHSNAEHDKWVLDMDARDSKQVEGGSKGGKKPKRRAWAEEMAERLASETDAAADDEAWNWLAGNTVPHEFDLDDAEYKVYVDGGYLIGVNSLTGAEKKIAKSTFLKNYYRNARKTG